MDAITRAYLALSLTPGLGPRKIKRLSEHFGDAERVYRADVEALLAVEGIGPKLARTIVAARDDAGVGRELDKAARQGVTLLPLTHPAYPESLRHIYDPPPVLYVRGTLPAALGAQPRSIGVVGTRNASRYGLEQARAISHTLAAAGVVIVSGLALGIDTAAHRGAVEAEGCTVAVLGSGVDVVYPRHNEGLAERLLARGAIVSEYRLGTEPRAENFPGRNRIISGLARGVLVVEGGEKSGALITAEYALEEGRTLFALPGRVGDPRAAGTLALLKQGAVLTQGAEDILAEFAWDGARSAQTPAHPLSDQEALVVRLVREKGSPLLDDLVAASGLDAAAILPVLMVLELHGIVASVPGERYVCPT